MHAAVRLLAVLPRQHSVLGRVCWRFSCVLTSDAVKPFAAYAIKVFTGDMRGAGTRAKVSATLIGDRGTSARCVLSNQEQIERDSAEEFVVTVDSDIGEIQRLRIGHDESNLGSGWLLERAEVRCLYTKQESGSAAAVEEAGKVLHFGCFRWLGTSDSGGVSGPAERELLVAEDIPVRHTSLTPARAEQHADHMRRFGRLRLFSGIACAPHPDKVKQGEKARQRARFASAGEDCVFVHESADANNAVLGAADGVYEWKMRGIDAGEYSRALLAAAQRMCEEADSGVTSAPAHGTRPSALGTKTIPELKDMLRERGLAVSGRKGQLLERLASAGVTDDDASAGSGVWQDGGALDAENTALSILDHAAKDVVAQGCQGSCTAIIADVNLRYGLLHVANLGDSGLLLLRAPEGGTSANLASRFRTPQQEHAFGCPYQLGHHKAASQPSDAFLATLQLQAGDVLVLGTDGLFDNMHDERTAELLSDLMQYARDAFLASMDEEDERDGTGKLSPRGLRRRQAAARALSREAAQALLKEAFYNSLDKKIASPYAKGYMAEFDLIKDGGKKDDIAIVVAFVAAADDFENITAA